MFFILLLHMRAGSVSFGKFRCFCKSGTGHGFGSNGVFIFTLFASLNFLHISFFLFSFGAGLANSYDSRCFGIEKRRTMREIFVWTSFSFTFHCSCLRKYLDISREEDELLSVT